MSVENNNHLNLLNQSLPQFEIINGLASEVGEQNTIYTELVDGGEITIEPFLDLVDGHLRSEQQSTFGALVEAGEAAPYAEIAKRDLELNVALGRAAAKLSAFELQQITEAEKIRKEQELLADRLPKLAPRISEITARLEQALITKAKQALEAEHADIEAQQAAMTDIYEAASQAWPIPKLLVPKQPESPEPEEPEIVIVDDFPKEGTKPTRGEIVEKVHHKYSDDILQDASEFVALLLAEEPKFIYTQEELAEVTYGSAESKYRTRVSALVSSFELGKVQIIGKILKEHDLVFQKGERTSHRKDTGKQFGKCQPIYRAVSVEEANLRERIVHCETDIDWMHDTWHTIIFHSEAPVIADDVSAEDLIELQARNSALDKEKSDQLTDAPEEHILDVDIELRKSVMPEPVKPTTPSVKPQQPQAPATPEKPKSRIEPKWIVDFKADLKETIAHFEADGLMLEDEVSWQVIKLKSSSRSMGTKTMAKRAVSNGIISKPESSLDSTLPIARYICMALQNSYQALFTNRSRRKIVMKIVDEAVANHFEEAKKSSK